MSFGIYFIGFILMIGGLTYGAHLMHVPTRWIVAGAIVLLGLGILKVSKQRARRIPRDSSSAR